MSCSISNSINSCIASDIEMRKIMRTGDAFDLFAQTEIIIKKQLISQFVDPYSNGSLRYIDVLFNNATERMNFSQALTTLKTYTIETYGKIENLERKVNNIILKIDGLIKVLNKRDMNPILVKFNSVPELANTISLIYFKLIEKKTTIEDWARLEAFNEDRKNFFIERIIPNSFALDEAPLCHRYREYSFLINGKALDKSLENLNLINLNLACFPREKIEKIKLPLCCESINLTNCSDIPENIKKQISTLNKLKELSLDFCDLTDIDLNGLKELSNLEHLDLSYNAKITFEGLKQLKCLEKIKHLNVCETKIHVSFDQIKEIFPNLTILDGDYFRFELSSSDNINQHLTKDWELNDKIFTFDNLDSINAGTKLIKFNRYDNDPIGRWLIRFSERKNAYFVTFIRDTVTENSSQKPVVGHYLVPVGMSQKELFNKFGKNKYISQEDYEERENGRSYSVVVGWHKGGC